jgi:diguanylate cyclase (GGDEF)-like protein/PAS domain S-box-containing protein
MYTTDPRFGTGEIAALADRLLAPVAVISADSTLLYVNAAAARAVGSEPAWLIGRRMLDLVHTDDRPRIQRELDQVAAGRPAAGSTIYRIRADGAHDWRTFESIADNLLDDSTVAGILISSRDITDQVADQRSLLDIAYRDQLTGLANRTKVHVELEEHIDTEAGLSIAFLGLDRFKLINDSLGHTAGDEVLRLVSKRISSALPSSILAGRFDSDVFVVMVTGPAVTAMQDLLWRVVERINEPLFIAGHELRVSASAGIAHRNASATTESLLRDAGLALHRAKAAGGHRVEQFETAMRDAAVARLALEADLRTAIADDAFTLALQPIVRLDDRTTVRAEALVRWHRGDETIAPSDFIPVAEETGLIVALGDTIIDKAAQHARRAPGSQVLVNLSPRQLASPGLPERIGRALNAHRLPASSLGFELTETLVIEQFDHTVHVLRQIRELGCAVGLDDFGTGYSSLGYLRRLPITFVKIDGSLSTDIDTDCQARAIVGAIVTMADALGLEVIAEGVETESQAIALRDVGCSLAQGYHLGRPAEN